MNEKDELLFTRRALILLVWPLLVDQLLNVFIGMVDVMMVGSLGEAAVSGVSLIDSLNNLVFQVLFAVSAGGNVVISRFVGAKNQEQARKSAAQLIALTVLLMVLFTSVILIGRYQIFGVLFGDVEEAVMTNGLIYMQLTALSYPALALYNASAAVFRATGDTKTPLKCSTLMNLLNIVGNAIGIYVLRMGVAGVALPTLLSRLIGASAMFYILQKRNPEYRIRKASDFKMDKGVIGAILSIGIPNGVESSLFNVGKLALSSLVATLGTASIAGFAVAYSLATYLYLPGNALGAAMLTVVGQCLGAGQRKQAKYYVKKLVCWNYLLLIPICLVMFVGKMQFISLYSLEGQSAAYASGLLVSHILCMVMWPLAFLIPYYFRASGRATFTMIVSITIMWIFRVGFAYLFVMYMGKDVLWIWYAMFIDWFVRVMVYVYALRRAE